MSKDKEDAKQNSEPVNRKRHRDREIENYSQASGADSGEKPKTTPPAAPATPAGAKPEAKVREKERERDMQTNILNLRQ